MATNKERQAALRKRRAMLGQKGRLIYLTDNEFKQIKNIIKEIRERDDGIITLDLEILK